MKKLFSLIILGSFMLFLIPSCNKDEDKAEKFSTATVEENKAVIEKAGSDFVKVMTRMKSIETIDLIANLGDVMAKKSSSGFLFSKDSKLFSTLGAFTATAKGEKGIKSVFTEMVSPKGLSEDPESIKQFWDDNVGTYTWNEGISDWDIVLGGTKIIFKFPSSDVSTTNDATFTVSNYAGVNISNPVDEDYTGDLPISLNADLKVGSKTLVTYVFSASYNTDGVPTAIASDLIIENYKFEVDITNNTEVVSVSYKFLENDQLVMEMSITGEGLFTESNYNANTITHTETHTYIIDYVWNPSTLQWVPVYDTYTDEWKETDFEEIINSATASFQLFNIALRGQINIKGLVDQLDLIDKDLENETITDEAAMNQYAAQINQTLNLRLVNVDNNEILAKAEAYVVNEVGYGYTDYYINFRLTFNDGSPIDLDTYFNSGFDSFVDELNAFITSVNSDFDLDMDLIDY
jgi:hypothetical protein